MRPQRLKITYLLIAGLLGVKCVFLDDVRLGQYFPRGA